MSTNTHAQSLQDAPALPVSTSLGVEIQRVHHHRELDIYMTLGLRWSLAPMQVHALAAHHVQLGSTTVGVGVSTQEGVLGAQGVATVLGA